MTFYALSALINAITSTILGVFVIAKNKNKSTNQVFSLFCLSAAVWSYAYYFWQISETGDLALFWSRVLMVGAIFLPVFYLHFCLILLDKLREKIKLLYFGYIFALFFLLINFTEYFIPRVRPKMNFAFWPDAGMLYHLFLLIWLFFAFYAAYLLYQGYKNTTGIKQEQLRYILMGTIVGYLGGTTNYFLWYDLYIPPIGNWTTSLYLLLVAYAILKYRLMDIRVAVKRSTVFTLLVAVLTVAYVLAAFLLSWLVFGGSYTLQSQIYIGLIVALLVATVFRPFYDWLRKTTDNFLFKGDYQPPQLIAEISNALSQTLEMDRVINLLEIRISQALRLEKMRVLVLGSPTGLNDQEYRLTQYFTLENQGPLVLEELKRKKSEGISEERTEKLIKLLEKSKTALAIPLFIQQKLIGLFVLSAKKSGEMFTQEDIRTLETIASQAAIAIANARSYQKIKDFSKTLQQEVDRQTKELKQANIKLKKLDKAKSEFISMASHQLRTPVSVIKGICSMMRQGDIKKMPKAKQERFLEGLWQKSLKLESIISDILNATEMTSSKFRVKKDQVELVDLAKLIQEIIDDFQEPVEQREIELGLKKPRGKMQVYAQKEYLREAISNLIDNAVKYTPSTKKSSEVRGKRKQKGIIKISLTKENDYVMIKIKDNGIGIPPDEAKKLFAKFERASNARDMYTDGSGLGLFIVKEIIEGHHGRVWLESELGKGSAFFIRLPTKLSKVDVREHIMEG